MNRLKTILFLICILPFNVLIAKSLQFKGQASAWINYNPNINPDLWAGARYIPQLNYKFGEDSNNLFDFELSANLNGTIGTIPFDNLYHDGSIKPYRIWARYSTDQIEIRAGLQKINFGSSTTIRPLMWFDKIDPRDPLQLTDGVWGILGRYYFLNNANIWLWALYGNKDPKTWEIGNTSQSQPEFGGRIQLPVPLGEIALTYHHRLSDTEDLDYMTNFHGLVPENRLGFDGKWDIGVGLWFEASAISKSKNIGPFTNQLMISAGTDYTFKIGNGINVIFESLIFTYNEKIATIKDPFVFSTLNVSYPLGLSDNLSAMIYYDWNNKGLYNIITWAHEFKNLSFYCLGYSNPKNYNIPLTSDKINLFAGTGIQLMLVFNH